MRMLMLAAAVTTLTGAAAAAGFERDRIAGATVYRNAKIFDIDRAEQLQLRADGRLTGNWRDTRDVSGQRYEEAGRVRGTWRVEGGRLCLFGRGLPPASRGCIMLIKAGFSPHEYAFTDKDGNRWQVFIHPASKAPTNG